MENPELVDQAAILLRTLNSAIQNGLDELPAIAQLSLDSIGAFYAANFYISLFPLIFGLLLTIIAATSLIIIDDKSEYGTSLRFKIEVKIGTCIGALIIGTFMAIIGFIGVMVTFSSYISPLGKILINKL